MKAIKSYFGQNLKDPDLKITEWNDANLFPQSF